MLTDAITSDLLATCPQFRIVLVGNTGVGKSSLVSNVFNISLNDIDIAHDRAGRADINHGYTCDENPRFVLHDSQGFEAGSTGNWDRVEIFLRHRSAKRLQDRVHTIWLCIEAPREGLRLQQTGDEQLLKLARHLNIPVIIVFTKYDKLVKEQKFLYAEEYGGKLSDSELGTRTETCFNDRIKEFKASTQASIVKVSTHREYSQRLQTLQELTNATRECLGDAEEGPLVPWVTAQRISARQKVETSISEGFKKYWRNLGKSAIFQGHAMNQCVWRIHDDILKVWNFNDPDKLLFQEDFFKKMLQLVSPVLNGYEAEVQADGWLTKCSGAIAGTVTAVGTVIPHVLVAAIIAEIGVLAFQFLYGRYQMIPLAARYLGVYIVDLTCILHRLFLETLGMKPPRVLSEELISDVVANYKKMDSWKIHKLVFDKNFMLGYEEKIKDLILEYTTPLDIDNLAQSTYIPEDAGHNTASGSVSNTPKSSKRSWNPFSRRQKGG